MISGLTFARGVSGAYQVPADTFDLLYLSRFP
jgi:hypothetical protein